MSYKKQILRAVLKCQQTGMFGRLVGGWFYALPAALILCAPLFAMATPPQPLGASSSGAAHTQNVQNSTSAEAVQNVFISPENYYITTETDFSGKKERNNYTSVPPHPLFNRIMGFVNSTLRQSKSEKPEKPIIRMINGYIDSIYMQCNKDENKKYFLEKKERKWSTDHIKLTINAFSKDENGECCNLESKFEVYEEKIVPLYINRTPIVLSSKPILSFSLAEKSPLNKNIKISQREAMDILYKNNIKNFYEKGALKHIGCNEKSFRPDFNPIPIDEIIE